MEIIISIISILNAIAGLQSDNIIGFAVALLSIITQIAGLFS